MKYLLPCFLLKSMALARFGTSDFINNNSKLSLSPKILLSEAHNLLTRVSCRSTHMIHFRYSPEGIPEVHGFLLHVLLNLMATIYFGYLLGVHRFILHVLLNPMTMICFRSSGFGSLNSQLLHALFFLECFTWSTRSVDVCPPIDRWSPTNSAIRASGVSTLHFCFLLKLTIHRHASLWI
jgi:hypothetical protein